MTFEAHLHEIFQIFLSHVIACTGVEEVPQVNGWRGEMKKLEVDEPDLVRGTGAPVPEEHVVDPEVAVYEDVEGVVVPQHHLSQAVHHDVCQGVQFGRVLICVAVPRLHGRRHGPQRLCNVPSVAYRIRKCATCMLRV